MSNRPQFFQLQSLKSGKPFYMYVNMNNLYIKSAPKSI